LSYIEVLFGIDIPDSSDYSILVRDFFGDSGAYTLTVTLAEDVGELGNEILIFGDDDGVPISSGFTNIDAIAGQLSETYAVTTWSATQDGPLEDDALQGYELVIWDSGDYRDEEGVASEDSFTILNYVGGGGDLLIVGASPTLFGSLELSQLADVAVIGDDPILTSSFSDGEIIELDQTIDAVVLDSTDVEDDENSVAFLARGPASADSGNLVGVATLDDSLGDQRTAILLTPFTALPATVRSTVLLNLVAWFGLSGS
jgi:hypothetical protein